MLDAIPIYAQIGAGAAALVVLLGGVLVVRRARRRTHIVAPWPGVAIATPSQLPSPPRVRFPKGSIAQAITAEPAPATTKTPSGRVTGLRPTHARR